MRVDWRSNGALILDGKWATPIEVDQDLLFLGRFKHSDVDMESYAQ